MGTTTATTHRLTNKHNSEHYVHYKTTTTGLYCMNIGSVLNRLSPVKGKYRPINYEYI